MAKPKTPKYPPTLADTPSTGARPLSADVEAHILQVRREHPRFVSVAKVMRTAEGRPIYAVTVTDRDVPDRDKQHVLIAAGQHGNEESGRIIALAVIDWLVSKAGGRTRRRQKVVVMPNVNPDGAEVDLHGTPGGVWPNLDHAPQGATSPEGIALEKVAWRLQPEVYVDLHARGYAGCSYGMVLYPPTRVYTEDDNLFHAIAADMARAGERAGIPQVTHPLGWPGWGSDDPNEPSSTRFAYREFKSIVMLTETAESNEHAYPVRVRARAGLARIEALLAWGNRRHPMLYYAGYPCMLTCGMFHRGVVAIGKTAAARRAGRIAIWRNAPHFKRFDIEGPEPPKANRITLEYDGERLPRGAGFQTRRKGRMQVASVRLDGRRLRPSETRGYLTWHDRCSTFVVVAIPDLHPGTHEIEVRYR